MNPKICKHCGLEFNNGHSLGGHQTSCKSNPGRLDHLKKLSISHIGKKMSDEAKRNLSNARKEFMDKNPGNVPYLLNHSSKESYPEKLLRQALEKRSITAWVYNYPIRRYSIDFAFIELKVAIEVDGGTHLLPEVKEKDRIRDLSLKEIGWATYRFTASDVKKDPDSIVEIISKILTNHCI